jgi:hypothetical protein
VSDATNAVLFNAVPLFVLAASYAAVAGAMLPEFWRLRSRAHLVDWGVVLVFPAVAAAAAIFGVLVAREQRAVVGHVWLSLLAIVLAIVPAALLLMRWRDHGLVAGGVGRTLEAEERVSVRDRELEAVTAISGDLVRARDEVDIARALVRHVAALLDVAFAAVTVVDAGAKTSGGRKFASTSSTSRPASRTPFPTLRRSSCTTSSARRSSAGGWPLASARRAASSSR